MSRAYLTLPLILVAAPVVAQETPDPSEEPSGGDVADEIVEEITVTGSRPRGSVVGDVPPEQTLTPGDVRAFGVSTIAELIEELAPQLGSGRGRGDEAPVVLLEGRRISSFREIRDIPTEAISRVEILPEEVALKYGYPANQRVTNIVLRQRFRAITSELELGGPTAGGSTDGEAEVNYLRINRAGRLNVKLEATAQSRLTESERDLLPNPSGLPYDLAGNVIATDGSGEIDPALSALAGQTVTIAPVTTATPGLADFASGANVGNVTNLGDYRTLQPATFGVEGNAVLSRTIFGDVAATANLGFEVNDSDALVGLPSIDATLPAESPFSPFTNDVRVLRYADMLGALTRQTRTRNLTGGFSANGTSEDWRWTLTGNYEHGRTETDTDRRLALADYQAGIGSGAINPFGPIDGIALAAPDTARSVRNNGTVEGVVNGSPFSLPAGEAGTTLKVGLGTLDLDSRSNRSGIVTATDITRRSADAQVNLDLPITSRRRAVLDAIGDLSLNLNAQVNQLSDFGTLTTWGYGANWSPMRQVRILASATREEGAPSAQQVGNPVLTTPNVRLYDFVRGETVDVIAIEGGNPGLRADNRNVFKLGANYRPFDRIELNLRADYTSSRIDDLISTFPTATAEIQNAFPDRFTRDPAGRLVQIDTRPINFARSEREEFRWGFNLSLPVRGTLQKQVEAAREAGQDPRAVLREAYGRPPRREGDAGPLPGGERRFGGRGGGGGGRFGGGGAGGGRVQFSLFHTLRLKETILIRDGLPELDLLDGSATGSSGGQPRHEIRVRTGFMKDGIGIRANADWQSATRVDGATPADTLFFGDLMKVDLRAFANLGQMPGLVRDNRWLRGTRVSLRLDNLFNRRIEVRDASGTTPLGYQPALLDPLGRTVRFEVRKLF